MVTHFQTPSGVAACAQRNGMHTAFQKTTDVRQVTCKRCIASDAYQATPERVVMRAPELAQALYKEFQKNTDWPHELLVLKGTTVLVKDIDGVEDTMAEHAFRFFRTQPYVGDLKVEVGVLAMGDLTFTIKSPR